MQMINIDSNTQIPIEQHFRVSAGPGAGKTHWIVNHIKNISCNSTRLMKTRKIACITYTNIAVNTIQKRLGPNANRADVSTIHSFLYSNVLKPYASFLIQDYSLNVTRLDGHNDPIIHRKKISEWINNHPNVAKLKHPYSIKQLTELDIYRKAISNWLSSLFYTFDGNKNLIISARKSKAFCIEDTNGGMDRRYLPNKCIEILETDLLGYKKLYWQEGFIDHDDVLFFSYQLIRKFPFILDVLRAKYPYFCVDEFQDTNPIQTAIIELLAEKETIVGVIGDEAQSIYSFQGAHPVQFRSFTISGMVDYTMSDNRRSTNQIIDVLNKIRVDITQNKTRNVNKEKPKIIVGEKVAALKKAVELCNGGLVYSLARDNITSNIMKREVIGSSYNSGLIDQLLETDIPSSSTHYRSKVVVSCIRAVELAHEGKYEYALKELGQLLSGENDQTQKKREELRILCLLLAKYDSFRTISLTEFYLYIKAELFPNISNFRNGKPKTFYDDHRYFEIALCVQINEDESRNKTIHKAKGDEFDNVLVIINKMSDMSFLIDPKLYENEEHRILYVAISRAKERLFISVPSLLSDDFLMLQNLFDIVEV